MEVIVLAAGQGKRMRSVLPKVLQPLAAKPMLAHVLNTARTLEARRIVVVYGHGGEVVREALDAFVRGDADLALKVCKDDAFVDQLNSQIQRELLTYMMADPTTITRAIRVNSVAKCLERIADHATNVAEMVIFMVKGKDIRHTA